MKEWVIILQQCSRLQTNAARERYLRQFILCFLSPLIRCLGNFDICTRCTFFVSRVRFWLLVCPNLLATSNDAPRAPTSGVEVIGSEEPATSHECPVCCAYDVVHEALTAFPGTANTVFILLRPVSTSLHSHESHVSGLSDRSFMF